MSGLRGAERAAFHGFAREHVRPSALARDEAGAFDRGLWRRLADAGLFRSAPAGDIAAAAAAMAGLAHGGLDVPLGLTAVAQWIDAHQLASFGDAEQRARHVERLCAGEWIAAVCNSEQHTGTQLRGIRSRVVPDGRGGHAATLCKSGASNLGDADVALVSAWKHAPGREPSLEVFVLPARAPMIQESHVDRLAGFRTGLTGSLRSPDDLPIDVAAAQLGPDGAGTEVLRLCFHLERLLIGALVQGCLDGLVDDCLQQLGEREAHDSQFSKHQYVQDKLTSVFALARRCEGLLALVERDLPRDDRPLLARLDAVSELLAVLKLTAVEDGLAAASTVQELHGYAGYLRACPAQKAHRDLLAFKMLGGSKELMKIALFRDLRARRAREP